MDVDLDFIADSAPPDDGRLNARRIQATIVERQAVLRRRRFRLVIGLALLVASVQLGLTAAHIIERKRLLAAITGLTGLTSCLAAITILRKLPKTSAPQHPQLPPPDFTYLGQMDSFAHRLEQMVDNNPVNRGDPADTANASPQGGTDRRLN